MSCYSMQSSTLHRFGTELQSHQHSITASPIRSGRRWRGSPKYIASPSATSDRSEGKIKGVVDEVEDRSVAHLAFLNANQMSQPPDLRIAGMQDFAAAVWERHRRIPSSTLMDPLMRIFDEFDKDRDGRLTAAELTAALRSRKVDITEELVQQFIEAADTNSNHTVEKSEFPAFIKHMATADLRSRRVAEQVWPASSESESDEEAAASDQRLQSVLTHSLEELHSKEKDRHS